MGCEPSGGADIPVRETSWVRAEPCGSQYVLLCLWLGTRAGFVVGRRLLDKGHGVAFLTGSEDLLPNLTKNELNSVLGNVWHAAVQQQIAKADAIIDVETILHAASENISMMKLAAAIHRGCRFKADPSSSPLQAARRFVPVADRLILSHALSGDRARSLGWTTSRSSVLKEVERNAREDALVSRLKLPGTECKEK
jgi:hypothetical protein